MKARTILPLVLCSVAALPGAAQQIEGEYLVEMTDAPMLDRQTAQRQAPAEPGVRRAALMAGQGRVRANLAAMGAEYIDSMTTVANLIAVRYPGDRAALMQIPGVREVYPVYRRFPLLDQARALHQAQEAWARIGGIQNAGRGIRIGIIDTGIDPQHPGFRDDTLEFPQGYPRFRRAADEAITTRKIIVARSYDDLLGVPGMTSALDRAGHGSAVAMSAAGVDTSASLATVSGMAPKAFLGVYRVFSYDNESTSDSVILRALEDAVADGMNVINLSLGADLSENAVDNLYSDVFRRAAEAGIVIVAAAGNSGPGAGTVGSPGYVKEAIAVAATAETRSFEFPVRAGESEFLGRLGSGRYDAGAIRSTVYDARRADPSGLACTALPAGDVVGKIAVIDRGDCFFEQKLTNAQTAGAVAAIVINNSAAEPINMTVGTARLPALMIRQADGASLRRFLEANPAEAVEVAFNGRLVFRDPRRMAGFSSRGPSILRSPKPDIGAIGQSVYTAAPATENSPEFANINGTSFASPIVAGAAGVLMAQRPGLSAAAYRSLLVGTAAHWGPEGGREFLPTDIGAGLLNLDAAIRCSFAASEISLNFGVASGSALRAARSVEFRNLAGEADTLTLELHWLSGQMPSLAVSTLEVPAGEARSADVVLDAAGMEPAVSMGIFLIRSASTGSTLRIPYWFVAPSAVPARVATYETGTPRAGVQTSLFFRLFDTTDLTIASDQIAVDPITTGTTVTSLQSMDQLAPGLYRLRFVPADGLNQLRVRLGDFEETISVRTN